MPCVVPVGCYTQVKQTASLLCFLLQPQPLPQESSAANGQNRDSTCTYAYIPVHTTERSEAYFPEVSIRQYGSAVYVGMAVVVCMLGGM